MSLFATEFHRVSRGLTLHTQRYIFVCLFLIIILVQDFFFPSCSSSPISKWGDDHQQNPKNKPKQKPYKIYLQTISETVIANVFSPGFPPPPHSKRRNDAVENVYTDI